MSAIEIPDLDIEELSPGTYRVRVRWEHELCCRACPPRRRRESPTASKNRDYRPE